MIKRLLAGFQASRVIVNHFVAGFQAGRVQRVNIKFKFYNPEQAHPCVISRLMSYRA